MSIVPPDRLDALDVYAKVLPELSDASAGALVVWRGDLRCEADWAELDARVEAAAAGDADALAELEDAFCRDLPIGTGGRRGRVGPGPNRVNERVMRQTARGLADFVVERGNSKRVVVVFDTRKDSKHFAEIVADELMAADIEVRLLDAPRPTPQLSFELRRSGAGAGVVISASHNPPEDNGIKIYGDDGAQVLGEDDRALMEAIVAAGQAESGTREGPRASLDRVDPSLEADAAYHAFVAAQSALEGDLGDAGLTIVYTPLHGVGASAVVPVLRARGLRVAAVEAQCDPDEGRFSTVASANPESEAALAMGNELAEREGADLVLANDPDADRLGACARDGAGVLRFIDGNRLGVLMLDHLIRHAPKEGLVITTLVTSPLMAKMARAAALDVVDDVLVGFKHHAGIVREREGVPLFFACEESHGYLRGADVRDKDGAVAALVLAEAAVSARREGKTLFDRLDDVWKTFGYHAERTHNLWAHGAAGRQAIAAVMEGLRARPPAELAGMKVVSFIDRAEARTTGSATRDLAGNVLVLELEGGGQGCRLVFRPSGTEPKLKVYALAHDAPGSDASARERIDTLISRVLEDAAALAGAFMRPHLPKGAAGVD